jgi:hypothetical protein
MTSKLKHFFNVYWFLFLIIALKFILQFALVNPVYELHRDEFLHLDQSNHFAFGYISVPPFTALISKIIFLLGGNLFWIRFFPALFGALTIVFAWLIVESLGGKFASKVLVSTALLFSVLMRMNILFQPNSFEILIWTVIFYLLIKYVCSENYKWLYYLSLALAIGFYNKYTLIFPLLGLCMGILFTHQRKLLLTLSLWKALLLTLILILPNLIWQISNHFPVIQHMHALKETQLDNNTSVGFIINQFVFFMGSVPLIFLALAAFIFYKPFKPFRFIGICYVATITIFACLKAKDYYSIGLYPVILVFGSVFIENILGRKWKLVIIPLLIIINTGIFYVTFQFIYPVLKPSKIVENADCFKQIGLLRWEDGKDHSLPQDFADMLGWREMANKSLLIFNTIRSNEKESTLVFCDNYGQVGALNYYNKGKMPEAYSFNTDYIYWLPNMKKIQNVLLIGQKPNQDIINMFSECKQAGIIENEYAREKGTGIYLLTGAKEPFTKLFYEMADERKKRADIFR